MSEAGGLWDESRTEALRRLWEEGRSAGQIASLLSEPGRTVTRNTICGKLHRLGLKGRPSAGQPTAPTPPRTEPRILTAAEARPTPAFRPLAPVPEPHQRAAAAPPPPATPAPTAAGAAEGVRRVTIHELASDMCRWPLGDPSTPAFRYCGNASLLGRPYCGHHSVMAYEPPRQRAARSG